MLSFIKKLFSCPPLYRIVPSEEGIGAYRLERYYSHLGYRPITHSYHKEYLSKLKEHLEQEEE